MDIFLSISALVLGIVGIVGSVLPIIPGVVIGYAGLLCSFFGGSTQMSPLTMWIWLIIAVVVSVADYFLPPYFTKMFGGSRASSVGAMIGLVAGLFFTPIGMILGTFLGAVVGELLNSRDDLPRALKAGAGAFLSFIVGTGIKLMTTIGMFFYICRDVFPSFAGRLAELFG